MSVIKPPNTLECTLRQTGCSKSIPLKVGVITISHVFPATQDKMRDDERTRTAFLLITSDKGLRRGRIACPSENAKLEHERPIRDHPTTTYATTYGWVSAGIRRELIASPRSKKRLDGTKRDSTGLNRCSERLATNQKAAGSSPAERTTKYLQMRRFCLVKCSRRSARTTHLTT